MLTPKHLWSLIWASHAFSVLILFSANRFTVCLLIALGGYTSWHPHKVTWKEFDEDFISSGVKGKYTISSETATSIQGLTSWICSTNYLYVYVHWVSLLLMQSYMRQNSDLLLAHTALLVVTFAVTNPSLTERFPQFFRKSTQNSRLRSETWKALEQFYRQGEDDKFLILFSLAIPGFLLWKLRP